VELSQADSHREFVQELELSWEPFAVRSADYWEFAVWREFHQ